MSAITNAQESWGDELPDWIHVLAQECDHTSQKKVADRIGYSPTAVNTLLKNTYGAELGSIEQAVRGALLSATVECPVMGDLLANICLKNQRRPFAATNPQRVRLYSACRKCLNNRGR